MILGVDHIALTSRDVVDDGDALMRLGFTERFRDVGIPNAACKRELQAQYRDLHDIAVFDHPSSVPLELTVHGPRLAQSAHFGFVPVVATLTPSRRPSPATTHGPVGVGEALREAFGLEATWYPYADLSAAMWLSLGAPSGGAPVSACCVADLDASTHFFREVLKARTLGAGTTGGRAWRALEFSAPIARWRLRLLLAAATGRTECQPLMLDSTGFPCIALLTSDIAKDSAVIERALNRPLDGRFAMEVNGKPLEIAIVRGPSGELVELIEVRRK